MDGCSKSIGPYEGSLNRVTVLKIELSVLLAQGPGCSSGSPAVADRGSEERNMMRLIDKPCPPPVSPKWFCLLSS